MDTQMISTTSRLVPAIVPSGAGGYGIGNISKTVLTDGQTYFCAREGCDYKAAKYASVRAHQGAHTTKPRARKQLDKPTIQSLRLELARLGELLDQAESGAAETPSTHEKMEAWKQRAVSAERELNKIRKALGALGLSVGQE